MLQGKDTSCAQSVKKFEIISARIGKQVDIKSLKCAFLENGLVEIRDYQGTLCIFFLNAFHFTMSLMVSCFR